MASISSINYLSGSSGVIKGSKAWFLNPSKKNVWASTWEIKYSDGSSKTFTVTLLNAKKIVSSNEKSKPEDLETITTYIQVDDPCEKKERNFNLSNNKNTLYSISLDHFADLGVNLNLELAAEKIDAKWKDEVSKYLDTYFKKPSSISFFSLFKKGEKEEEMKESYIFDVEKDFVKVRPSKEEKVRPGKEEKDSSSSSSRVSADPTGSKDEVPSAKSSSAATTVSSSDSKKEIKVKSTESSTTSTKTTPTQSKPPRQPCPSYIGPAIVAASVASFITYYLSNYMGQMICSLCNKN